MLYSTYSFSAGDGIDEARKSSGGRISMELTNRGALMNGIVQFGPENGRDCHINGI